MVHDPCNPVPSNIIPRGLPLQHRAVTKHVGRSKPSPLLHSHAVTEIAPIYIGCDHRHPSGNQPLRVNAVHFPAAVEVPATILLPRTNFAVATLSNIAPLVVGEGEPNTGILVPMPDPSGAALFLFAVFIAWTARRFNTRQVTKPSVVNAHFSPVASARLRHRSKSIAPFCALQLQLR